MLENIFICYLLFSYILGLFWIYSLNSKDGFKMWQLIVSIVILPFTLCVLIITILILPFEKIINNDKVKKFLNKRAVLCKSRGEITYGKILCKL